MTSPAPALPHILVVDDSGGVRRSLERSLSPYLRVTLAESVAEALSLLTPCVALVLSDILMPGESGFELAAILKREQPELPVVLFTGVVDAETRSRAHALGVETVLRKPLLGEQVLKVIQPWVGDLRPHRETAHAPAHPSGVLAGATGAVREAEQREAEPSPRPEAAAEQEIDRVGLLCRRPGVLAAAQLTELGEVERQWNLPLPPELGSRAVGVMRELEDCAAALGAVWRDGQFMQLPLADRVMLVGKLGGQCLCLVVRDMAVAGEVTREFQQLGESPGHQVAARQETGLDPGAAGTTRV